MNSGALHFPDIALIAKCTVGGARCLHMDDFSHLSNMEIRREATAVYELFALGYADGTCPKLVVRPATEANPHYYQEVVKRSSGSTGRAISAGMNPALLKRLREEDVELFAQYVVTGWENVRNAKGAQSQFTTDNVRGFLSALAEKAPDVFDELRTFCNKMTNFRPATPIAPKDAAGNS